MTRSEDSTPQRSPRIDDGGGASRFDEMPQQQRTPRKQPVMDEDMGIVRVEQRRPVHDREPQLRSPERASNSMAPRQQVCSSFQLRKLQPLAEYHSDVVFLLICCFNYEL